MRLYKSAAKLRLKILSWSNVRRLSQPLFLFHYQSFLFLVVMQMFQTLRDNLLPLWQWKLQNLGPFMKFHTNDTVSALLKSLWTNHFCQAICSFLAINLYTKKIHSSRACFFFYSIVKVSLFPLAKMKNPSRQFLTIYVMPKSPFIGTAPNHH